MVRCITINSSYLRVRFSTILTDVRFEVLRFFMFGYVLQQRGFINEAFVA